MAPVSVLVRQKIFRGGKVCNKTVIWTISNIFCLVFWSEKNGNGRKNCSLGAKIRSLCVKTFIMHPLVHLRHNDDVLVGEPVEAVVHVYPKVHLHHNNDVIIGQSAAAASHWLPRTHGHLRHMNDVFVGQPAAAAGHGHP